LAGDDPAAQRPAQPSQEVDQRRPEELQRPGERQERHQRADLLQRHAALPQERRQSPPQEADRRAFAEVEQREGQPAAARTGEQVHAGAILVSSTGSSETGTIPRVLIDCHIHLNNYHESSGRPTRENVQALFDHMAKHSVDHAVVLTSYKVDGDRPSVEELLELLANDPRTSVVEGLRWRGENRTDLFTLEERIRAGVVRGIKLYPGYENYAINDPSLETVMRIAAKYDVPVMIHCGDTYSKQAKVRQAHPLLVDDVAVDYPDVKFVICHLGNPWFQDTAEVLYKNENVYADISGLTLGDFTYEFERYLVQRVKDLILYMGDPGRQLLYGSDWPLVRMGPYIKFLESLDLTDEQRENIAWRTAARLFKIPVGELPKAS
jgi:predicted TIM-barrel fold metal-dependent hydrolase